MSSRDHPVVLLVDDDASFLQYLAAGLRPQGFVVHQAQDGMTALRFIEQRRPDAVVLDLDLPRLSGLAVLDELRARPDTRDLPVIVVTGTDWQPAVRPAGIFRKPFSMQRMTQLLSDVTGGPAAL